MDKQAAPDAAFFRLPDHHIVALTGRDAIAYAQAQTMNDVAALADRQWQWNGWLTPKGRVIALFSLLRLDAETLWLLLPDADAEAIADRLRGFVFRRKAVLAVREDLHVAGAFRAPATARDAIADVAGGVVELDFGAGDEPRTLRIGGEPGRDDAAALERWRSFDLRHGLPRLPPSQSEHWTPQQLSLDRLRAYSVKKGCYPGQEIVARTHFLGQAKRHLALLETPAPAAVGDEVDEDGRAAGSVLSTASAPAAAGPARHYALSVLAAERGTSLRVAGAPVEPLSLRAGLQR
ncbi:YgfZ/GcvT domain-containing protein [Luteimonas aquatica]|uniref:CAF17-like 4Fe-4S cluster assembly/insertion protein YgfZ n=1 Tax=Luteimonas aquatica TaxID=450364 RepID=UPI001F561AE9|nr:folate-binding protein [Luteimonas aquatica]